MILAELSDSSLRKKQLRLPVWQAPPPRWSTRKSTTSPSQSIQMLFTRWV